MRKCRKKRNIKGFTLVELMVSLVILAILVAVSIPSFVGFIDKARGMTVVSNTKQAYMASSSGLQEWIAAGSPGNGDNAYKINIEKSIIGYLELGDNMQSYTATKSSENSVQVALSLPAYYSQGWAKFIDDCKNNNYKNFIRVWVGKNPDLTIGDTIKAVYYVSPDGKTATRIVYDDTTKLGSVDQRAGTYTEHID